MIYLDNGATTKPYPEVIEQMLPFLQQSFGNASSSYGLGMQAKKALNASKRKIAGLLGASMQEIIITSGGTEADNLAFYGIARAYCHKGRHIITSKIEHKAILRACEVLEKEGFEITYLPVNEKGLVSIQDLEQEIRRDTILISIQTVNNEIGSIQPIQEIGRLAKKKGIVFHTDAVAGFGKLPLDVSKLGVDLLSASSHKFHGPKGIGFLYVREGIQLHPMIVGGNQEGGYRAGTENIPAVVGMAKAAELTGERLQENQIKLSGLKEYFGRRLKAKIPGCVFLHPVESCVPGTLSVAFPGTEAETLLIQLDLKGICASGGSACTTGDRKPSHVLAAIGARPEEIKGTLRFTLSEENTEEELEQVVQVLAESVSTLKMKK